MRTRFLFAAAAAAALTLAACSDSSTAPRLSPSNAAKDITCRSGYHIATRDDGTETCEPDGDGLMAQPAPQTPTSQTPSARAARRPLARPARGRLLRRT